MCVAYVGKLMTSWPMKDYHTGFIIVRIYTWQWIDLTWQHICVQLNKHGGCKVAFRYINSSCICKSVLSLHIGTTFAVYIFKVSKWETFHYK